MLTSKQRAELRSQANGLETTLIVGKEGITDMVIREAENLLSNRELVKGKVLETSLLSAREACDAICEAIGADGVQTLGSKFVFFRVNEKLRQAEAAKRRAAKKENPVRKGAQARRAKAKQSRQEKNEYFRQAAVQAAIDRRRQGEE